ncbi:para-nitrobenzyl esterase [Mumia flava]|uniref:Carboxylic ester hydrolase n=1 Tax=Mumia flava TaxID=1348852 RepID=A0A2M9BIK1_9ACTN|nr:carboxylesterase family protein [Mumia flava]PJJ57777.1 para-nitrobenzyl esterase [Mumia flava]
MQQRHRSRRVLGPLIAALGAGALAAGVLAAPVAAAPGHDGPGRGAHDRHDGGGRHHDATVVRVTGGTVRGTDAGAYRTFEGIPFAAPPVGDLRFAPPQRVERWSGTLDATAPRSQCAQITTGTGNPTTYDEDCLYLNVTTPAGASSRRAGLPVMVWIHGGSFLTGTGGSYDASKLATQGDAVVVTVNYRLGPLGFLAHPDLTGERRSGSGVAGLLDQQAALRWVQRNIRTFGGNPRNVTIFGESAGGASVCANLASPDARPLFRRAIAQSYSCASDLITLPQAETVGAGVAGEVGCAEAVDVASCLRDVDVATLLDAWPGGVPAVGGTALPVQPGRALEEGVARRIDLMHGNTLDENRLFIPLEYGTSLTAAQYVGVVGAVFGDAAPAVLGLYPSEAYPSPTIALSTIFSDYGSALSTCTHVDAYEAASASRGRVYAYQFQDRTADPLIPLLGDQNGAAHATELPYLFPGLFGDGLTPEQETLSDAMVAYWTSFAATGRPRAAGLPRWPRYSGHGDVLALDLAATGGVRTEDVAAAAHCGFWSAFGQPPGGDVISR